MIVKDLIAKLQEMNPYVQVLIDMTPENSDMFKYVELQEVEQIGLEMNGGEQQFCSLSPYIYESEPSKEQQS